MADLPLTFRCLKSELQTDQEQQQIRPNWLKQVRIQRIS